MCNRKMLAHLGDYRRRHALPAYVAPVNYQTTTGAQFGFETTLGDFPASPGAVSTSGTGALHGVSGTGSDRLSYIYLPIAALTAPVHHVELRLNITAFPQSPNVPSWNVRAVKQVSPVQPDFSVGAYTTPGDLYAAPGVGWTVASQLFAPLDGETGIHRLDVTDIVNEIITGRGSTGTALLFVMDPIGDPVAGPTATVTFSGGGNATLSPRITIYPDLRARDYQAQAIAGGTVGYFIPFDAVDRANLSRYRSVVANGHGGARADAYADNALFPINGVDDGVYAVRSTRPQALGSVYETNFPEGRRLMGPEDPAYPGDPQFCMWPVNFRDYSVLVMCQVVQFALGDGMGWYHDQLGTTGLTIAMNTNLGGASGEAQLVSGATIQQAPPAGIYNVVGSVKTLAWYYDTTTNLWHAGEHNGDPASGFVWAAPVALTDAPNDRPASGFGISENWRCQGVLYAEFSTVRRLAEIKQAVAAARRLWAADVKAIPPVLY